MTVGELAAYADEMPALHAEWMLDAAQVAIYPSTAQFAPDAARTWWDSLMHAAAGDEPVSAAAMPDDRTAGGFSLNGKPISFDALSANLSYMLGGGVAA